MCIFGGDIKDYDIVFVNNFLLFIKILYTQVFVAMVLLLRTL